MQDVYPGSRIPDPDFSIPDPGAKKHWNSDPDPQHCIKQHLTKLIKGRMKPGLENVVRRLSQ